MCIENSSKGWVDIFSALAPTAIAVFALIIAWQQWGTSRQNHKLQLFEKRYALYKIVRDYVAKSLSNVKDISKERSLFLEILPDAVFLFDDKVASLLNEIDNEILDLDMFESELSPDIVGEERTKLVKQRRQSRERIRTYLQELPGKFKEYMHLKH